MFRVLAFTVKPVASADSRYRILQFIPSAEQYGILIHHKSLIGPRYFQWQLQNQQTLLRLLLYPILLVTRLWQVLWLAPKYDAVWVSREMAPLGPPVFEWLLFALCRRVILDIDDALHISDKRSSRLLPRLLRDYQKFARLASSYSVVVCGNSYLAEFYRSHSAVAHIIPTVVNADRYSSIGKTHSNVPRIGWIGTPLNGHHLELLRAPLVDLSKERQFELVIVGLSKKLDWPLNNIRYLDWSLKDELSFFAEFDIGVMPLEDSAFARGKCAFKLIQYMAAGLPVVASPVGANSDVVKPGINGCLASTADEWRSSLRQLIDDADLRSRMGASGRDMVRRSYSVEVVWPCYAAILTGVGIEEALCAS